MATRLSNARERKAAGSQAHHRDTPPEDVRHVEAGLLACGSLPRSGLPGLKPSGSTRRWLTAHSCGGSAGIVPITRSARTGFPLGSGGSNSPKNLDVQHYGRQPTARQVKYKEMLMSLYLCRGLSGASRTGRSEADRKVRHFLSETMNPIVQRRIKAKATPNDAT
jgi:hypothetical protein